MSEISIAVDPGSMKRGAHGNVVGTLRLRGSAADFPSSNWFDFPVVVLAWWIDGLVKLASGEVDSFRGLFMDGPYAFVARARVHGLAEISWGTRGDEQPVGVVALSQLLKSAVDAGAAVVGECRARRWHNPDLEKLEIALARVAT